MTVRQLLRSIDAAELTEWQVYARLEPWDETRADLRAGILASVIANIWRGKDAQPLTPRDFMPDFDPEPAPAVDEDALILEQQRLFEAMVMGMGGKVIDGEV